MTPSPDTIEGFDLTLSAEPDEALVEHFHHGPMPDDPYLSRVIARRRALACELANERAWRPIETAPKDGTFILVAGDSGCRTTPLRVAVARWYPEYRPHNPWQTHSNDAFTDDGAEPAHWRPLPKPPEPRS